MYKRENTYSKNFELPPEGLGSTQYWCNALGITAEEMKQMSDDEMEHRINHFQLNYLRSAKNREVRHAAYQSMKEQSGNPVALQNPRPSPQNTPRSFREQGNQRSTRQPSPQRMARKTETASAKVRMHLEEEAAAIEEEKQRLQKKLQEKQQKQMARKRQEEMKRQEEVKRQEELQRQELLKREEMKYRQRQSRQHEQRQRQAAAQSPNRGNTNPNSQNPQRRNASSPTRQQQQQPQEEAERRRAISPNRRQLKYAEEIQRQNKINEEAQRQRRIQEEKQKQFRIEQQQLNLEKFKEQQRRILEDQLLLQQQEQEQYGQSDGLPSQEDGNLTEATEATEPEDNVNDYDGYGRLVGGQDGEEGQGLWDILTRASDQIEGAYGNPAGPKASSFPPGEAVFKMKGADGNNNTYDLLATYGPNDTFNYQNNVNQPEQAENCYESGGQDYIEGEIDDQEDYGEYDESSNYDPEDNLEYDFPETRTVRNYDIDYVDDGIEETMHNVTVQNRGNARRLTYESRSFMGAIPGNYDAGDDECGYDDYQEQRPLRNTLNSIPGGGRLSRTSRVTQGPDGHVKKVNNTMHTDRCGRTHRSYQ